MTTTQPIAKTYGKSLDYILPEYLDRLDRLAKFWSDHDAWVTLYREERNAHPRMICPTCGCDIPDHMMRDNETCEYCEIDDRFAFTFAA